MEMEMEMEKEMERECVNDGEIPLDVFEGEEEREIQPKKKKMKKSQGDMKLCITRNHETETSDDEYLFDCSDQDSVGSDSLYQKRVYQWSMEEHRRFLAGLKEMGKGNWKEIAVKYVKSRSAGQVASHAQKYYGRKSSKRKARSSLFDSSLKHASASPASPLKDNDEEIPLQVGEAEKMEEWEEEDIPRMTYLPMVVLPNQAFANLTNPKHKHQDPFTDLKL